MFNAELPAATARSRSTPRRASGRQHCASDDAAVCADCAAKRTKEVVPDEGGMRSSRRGRTAARGGGSDVVEGFHDLGQVDALDGFLHLPFLRDAKDGGKDDGAGRTVSVRARRESCTRRVRQQ